MPPGKKDEVAAAIESLAGAVMFGSKEIGKEGASGMGALEGIMVALEGIKGAIQEHAEATRAVAEAISRTRSRTI